MLEAVHAVKELVLSIENIWGLDFFLLPVFHPQNFRSRLYRIFNKFPVPFPRPPLTHEVIICPQIGDRFSPAALRVVCIDIFSAALRVVCTLRPQFPSRP